MRLLYIGFGNVAKEMARIFTHRELYPKLRLAPETVGIFTARHGGVEDAKGLDLAAVLENMKSRRTLTEDGVRLSPLSPLEAAQRLDYDVLVELSALSIKDRGEPAVSHIRAALSRGKSVVSANKGPVAFHYRELQELAAAHGAQYLFESAVMDGAPVFNLARRCMKGARVTGFSGILNGTTNFILAHMEKGGTLEEGIRIAQEEGIAEADPSMDVDGWDPAAKTAALANVLMDADVTPLDVDRSGIRGVTAEAAQAALKHGARLKLICRGFLEDGRVKASVKVEEVPMTSVFALVPHFGAALRLESDLLHPNYIFQEQPDLTDTAFGCIEDLETIAEKVL